MDVGAGGRPTENAGVLATSRVPRIRAFSRLHEAWGYGMTYRIALVDDESLVREFIRRFLEDEHDLEIVAEAVDGASLLDCLRNAPALPDLVIADITMPPPDGIELTRQIRQLYPAVKVLILTMHNDEEYISPALKAGAAGFLLKDDVASELIPAIRIVLAGSIFISSQFKPHFKFTRPPGDGPTILAAEDQPEAGEKRNTAKNGGG